MGLVKLRIHHTLEKTIRQDLLRPHPFAYERVGFVSGALGYGESDSLILLPRDYRAVADEHYIKDEYVGARINSEAIRAELQHILHTGLGSLHVHMHGLKGRPRLSPTDLAELPLLVKSMRSLKSDVPHGLLILSEDDCWVWIWLPGEANFVEPESVSIVGSPLTFSFKHFDNSLDDKFDRQSFLGDRSQGTFRAVTVGVVGLGGGGSHVVQQLAHLGFRNYRVFDGDVVEDTNLNRLIGATVDDVEKATNKIAVAERVVKSLQPDADFKSHLGRWQENPELLRGCDVVFGCVDGFAERRELEVICRRYLIPYIDIGMDVHKVGSEPARMAGQVILSMPGGPCMFCLGFLNEERLAKEAATYGNAGKRPQVVWANGVLASTAVGLGVALLTGWSRRSHVTYFSFDGNTGTLQSHPRLEYVQMNCEHYSLSELGNPVWKPVLSET
jgi:hypothetical protein